MTVITFAKKGTLSTFFDSRSLFAGRRSSISSLELSRPGSLGSRLIAMAAYIGMLTVFSIIALGIHAIILTLTMTERMERISLLEKRIEQLRAESFARSNPRYISEQARMLQLIAGNDARYVTLGAPEELALGHDPAGGTTK